MDLKDFTLEDCIIAAYKSEFEAEELYVKMADSVENAFLKDRFKFLAQEEKKHQRVFENWYQVEFEGKSIFIPDKSPVPLPEIVLSSEKMQISEVIEQAINAENTAFDFYSSMAELFDIKDERRKTLKYIASMEKNHAQLLENELGNVKEFESFHEGWSLMHLGP